jgi:hypothetical protein
MPKPTDLSYFNWETQTSTSNSSPNFQVMMGHDWTRMGPLLSSIAMMPRWALDGKWVTTTIRDATMA